MSENKSTVFHAKNISEVLYYMKNIPSLAVIAGCSGIAARQCGRQISLPEFAVSIRNVPELLQIAKTERYIDFGAAVPLSQILELGAKRIPSVLYQAIRTIGTPTVRNMGTLGGNTAGVGMKMTAYAPLLALDSKLEIRTADETVMLPLSKTAGIEPNSFISKIRVPTDEWDIAVFRRIGCTSHIDENSASFVFLAKTQKNILTDLRIAFAGPFTFRNRQYENILTGTGLPVSPRAIQNMMEQAEKYLSPILSGSETPEQQPQQPYSPVVIDQFMNLLRSSLQMMM